MTTKRDAVNDGDGQLSFELVTFDGSDELGTVDLNIDTARDTIWASTEDMAELFGKNPKTINDHLRNIFKSGELDEATSIRKFQRDVGDGRIYKVLHYNLDTIISVGYRVNSRQATKFRQWATNVLKRYIVEGYALNESRLAEDPSALRKLAAEVRKLRTEEKNIYQSVRDCFKISSSDYNPRAKATASFYAKLQDKFLYAISGKTAAQIVIERANGMKDLMGMTSTKSGRPTKHDSYVGKNYLDSDELYALHLLCEQFLLFVESRAIAGKQLTMAELDLKFDQLLEVQGYQVFSEYKEFLRAKAKKHAEKEYERYRQRMRLEKRNLDGSKALKAS